MDKSIDDMHKRCNICNIYTILFQAVVVCLHFPSNNFGADHSILLGTDFWTLLELRNRNTFGSSFDWHISATGGGRRNESLLSLGEVASTPNYSDLFLHCPQRRGDHQEQGQATTGGEGPVHFQVLTAKYFDFWWFLKLIKLTTF